MTLPFSRKQLIHEYGCGREGLRGNCKTSIHVTEGKSRKDAPPVAIVTIRMSLLYDNAKSKRFHRTFIRPIAYLFNPFVIDFTNDISRICAPCIIKFRTNPKTFLRKKCSCASSERFANIIKSRLRRTLFHSLATGNKPVGEIS